MLKLELGRYLFAKGEASGSWVILSGFVFNLGDRLVSMVLVTDERQYTDSYHPDLCRPEICLIQAVAKFVLPAKDP